MFDQHGYTLFYKKTPPCHYLLVPTDPVIGVEDWKNRGKHNYWKLAWDAAKHGTGDIKHLKTTKRLALAINPATKRSQHQLHIHIGRLPKQLRNKLNKHDDNWHKITISSKDGYAKFFKGVFPRVFHQVSKKVLETNMKHYGIIVAESYDKKKPGFYIVYCKNTFVEGALNYYCPGN
jgi:CDP-diacylglycerol pyrophosphatase